MPLKLYRPHEVESYLADMYRSAGIYSPADMTLDAVADAFGVIIIYMALKSFVRYTDRCPPVVGLDNRLPEPEQRKDFFHELAHVNWHAGSQRRMHRLFRQLQEVQAAAFQLYAAIPWYLIRDMPLPETDREVIGLWASEFRVPPDLAARRLDQIRRRIMTRRALGLGPVPDEPMGIVVTYPETERLLQQLYRQIKQRKGV